VTGLEKLSAICGVYYLMGGGVQPVTIDKLKEIADQIERETLPRPTDVDGNVLNIGDRVHMLRDEYNGTDEWDDVIVGFCYDENTSDPWTVYGERGGAFACCCSVEPPDTWERIVADAKKTPCDYFGYASKPCCDGDVCPAYVTENGYECDKCKVIDLVRRCKALAWVE
jgi:hypothetical protein